jgi:hypothetical protein
MRVSAEVPVCLRATTDGFVLIGLLESMFRRGLTPYHATLNDITSVKLKIIVNELLPKAFNIQRVSGNSPPINLKMGWRKTLLNCSTQQYFGKKCPIRETFVIYDERQRRKKVICSLSGQIILRVAKYTPFRNTAF